MERPDYELEAIKKLLQNNEESYRPGAWEAFSARQQERKKKVIIWPKVAGIAAALILIISVILSSTDHQHPGLLKPESAGKAAVTLLPFANIEKTARVIPQKKQLHFIKTVPYQEIKQVIIVLDTLKNQPQSTAEIPAFEKKTADTSISLTGTVIPITAPQKKTYGTYISSSGTSDSPGSDQFGHSDQWGLGILVSGGMHNSKKSNIGLTATVNYALSNRISISSGLGYQQMAGSGQNDIGNSSSALTEVKALESVDLRLNGIELPIGISYRLSKRTYATVGISAFSVLKKSGELKYVTSTATEKSFVDDDGQIRHEFVLSQERTTERLEVSRHKESNFLGFFNLSLGYQQNILGNQSINLAPYLKIPMKSNTRDQVNLVSAGLNIGITF